MLDENYPLIMSNIAMQKSSTIQTVTSWMDKGNERIEMKYSGRG